MFKKNITPILAVALTAATLFSCKENTTEPVDQGALGDIVLVTVPVADRSAFVGTLKDLTVSNYANENAHQTTTRTFAYTYKDWVFCTPRSLGDVFKRFKRTTSGLVPDGEITLPSGANSSNIVFVDDNKAYLNYEGLGKIQVFNPTAFTLTKVIDLTGPKYAVGDNNPDPVNMHLRTGKLYVALSQYKLDGISYDSAYVAIVDVATDMIDKRIFDKRASTAGGHQGMFENMFTDEKGDLYMNCVGSYGQLPGQHHGMLRIKAGETEFDPTYFFDFTNLKIDGVLGGGLNYVFSMVYAGNGVAYARGENPALFSSVPDYINDRNLEALKIDVYNQKITKVTNIPNTTGYASDVCIYKGKIVFPTSSKDANGLFTLDVATGEASKTVVVNVQNFPWCIRTFNN